jgi:hypothetical protein
VFLYLCPDDSNIKEKMVYSSTRWNVIHKAEELGHKPARRVRPFPCSPVPCIPLPPLLLPSR